MGFVLALLFGIACLSALGAFVDSKEESYKRYEDDDWR